MAPAVAGSPRDVPPEVEDGGPDAYTDWLSNRRTATLKLIDGTEVSGFSFGYEGPAAGEVVFNTGMVGYPESLSDPSYAGQLLVITYPLVGNYGVAAEEEDNLGLLKSFESSKIHVKAVIVSEYSFTASHYTARRTLGTWLKSQGVPGIYGVDTRALTKKIRVHGALLGKIIVQGGAEDLPFDDPNERNLADEVCRKEKQVFEPPSTPIFAEGDAAIAAKSAQNTYASRPAGSPPFHIVAVDCGMKNNIIRYFVNVLRVKLTVVPWNYDFTKDAFDGLFLSNGPGDPSKCTVLVEHVKTIMKDRPNTPIFGICLGNQILGLAAGGSTYKMKFGNRGMNQPVVDLRTARCYITPQNHGFALDNDSLPAGWKPLMRNANDNSNEGIVHCSRPWFSVQFHPEASGGPTDTAFLFTEFLRKIAEPTTTEVTTIPYRQPVSYRKVLVLGSGGLTIGQAGEFDYSGSQAIKALRERGVQSIVVNPNVATIQTSWGLADKVYFLPVTVEFVTQVIKRERPDGVFCTFGGQTALNCAIKLREEGIFEKYNVEVLGTPIATIITTEDRDLFAKAVAHCGYKVAESACCESVDEACNVAKGIGYPVLVRAAFALGGLGSGFASDEAELKKLVTTALVNSPQVIIDKSLKGWKELEYEVVRDRNNNCITVCNMENFDPMGIHTGDSIVIAPSQTLTNDEYFRLRECAVTVVRHLGVVGECNIQYAVDPKSREFRIVEVNARLSRSSALASKATGYPLAYVAAKLALGSDLVTLRNSVTRSTTACFEPSLDYIVAKVPRWDLRKFTTVDQRVGSCMKSVGEVMAIGKNFEEIIQKALRMVDDSCSGFDAQRFDAELGHRREQASTTEGLTEKVRRELEQPTPVRIFAIAKAFTMNMSVEQVHDITKIDRWFLSKLYHIHRLKECCHSLNFEDFSKKMPLLKELKRCGFSDKQIAQELQPGDISEIMCNYDGGPVTEMNVRSLRQLMGICPVVKQIDTLAAEFPAETNYLYLTYSGDEHDISYANMPSSGPKEDLPPPPPPLGGQLSAPPSPRQVEHAPPRIPDPNVLTMRRAYGFNDSEHNKRVSGWSRDDLYDGSVRASSVIVLGCGPYRIGSSVEFDWCGVSCVKTLRSLGHEAVIINCNPETVSTDFDESDRLYFEELSIETVLDIVELEDPGGVIVSVGGQTPNNLAMDLHANNVKILGTAVEAIDACEDRYKFSQLCDSLCIEQPRWSKFTTTEEAFHFCRRVGYPALVRPSYVLSGAAMRVVDSDTDLEVFLKTACVVSPLHPVVISKYIQGAKEVELDAVGQNGEILNYAVAEHVENAGVHSGDATLLLPAQKLFVETHRRVKQMGQKICRALKISGPFNIQFICKDNDVKVIECNLRASRSMPFISKTYNVNFIDIATRVMLGHPCRRVMITPMDISYISCKAAMFSFQRLIGSDPRLGVEMQSTGEVACIGVNMYEAFLKAIIAAGFRIPQRNILVSIGKDSSKKEFVSSARQLVSMGYTVYATKGTYDVLTHASEGVQSAAIQLVHKPSTKKEPNALTLLKENKVDLTINIPSCMDSRGLTDGYTIRRTTIDFNKPLITDLKMAVLACASLHHKQKREMQNKAFYSYLSWQEYCALDAVA